MTRILGKLCILGIACCVQPAARADHALVAVATNFVETMQQLEADFERNGGHSLTLVPGSTGKLYAQIANGAPFDVFLAADQERPRQLEVDGLAVADSRFTYAVGRLVLWSRDADRIGPDGAAVLRQGEFRRLAIANPALAPYGAAARDMLVELGLYDGLRPRLVIGENVGQAFAMVATGNAELGFVALSYVLSPRNQDPGSRWDVPREFYAPIRQDGVLLGHGTDNKAASDLLRWLHGDDARTIIMRFGYDVE